MIAALLSWFRSWFAGTPTQTCWVWCPHCRNELTAMPEAFVYDAGGDEPVRYSCNRCGCASEFDFAHYPVPVLLSSRPLGMVRP